MSFLKLTESQKVVTVLLNRPDVRNAFNAEMIEEIRITFQRLSQDKGLKALVLRGEGKAFCAGGDLLWMKDVVNYTHEENKRDALALFSMFEAILSCPFPVIGAVHGAAFGGAMGLMACCDYVIAEEKTQFCFSEVKLGIAPAVISAFILKKCSLGQVSPWMLSGHVFSPAIAKNLGLVHDSGEDDDFQDKVEEAANWFRNVGPQAVRETKTLLHKLGPLPWNEQRDECVRVISDLRVSAEGQEGLKSFLQKREPSWRLR